MIGLSAPGTLSVVRQSAAIFMMFVLCCAAHASSDKSVDGEATPGSGVTMLDPDSLEEKNAVIGDIHVVTNNIFDTSDPAESKRFHRLANALHTKTRPETIAVQLLFEPGDVYSTQVAEETERLLRSNRYLRDANVMPVLLEDGVVDLEVQTNDVWTLSPSISFGRGGGENSGGIGLKEYNLFGLGTSIGIGYKSNVDRDTTTFRYYDRNLFGSRYELATDYSGASDGTRQSFSLEKPFFELDAKHAQGLSFRNGNETTSLYDRGEIVSQFEHRFSRHEAYYGWSAGLRNNWTRRYISGLGYTSSEYRPAPDSIYAMSPVPTDRRYLYPFFGVEFVQDDYVTTRNFDQMNRTEDRHLGQTFGLRVGYASESFGSSGSAWFVKGNFGSTLLRTKSRTITVGTDLDGRIESGLDRHLRLTFNGRYDWRQSDKRLFHARLSGTLGENLDIENPNYLGGDNGLRGYPLRYQGGDKSILLSLEQRYFTDWYPWHLFNIGGAVFFDAGRTWGSDPANGKNLGWLRDIGFGLRIGSTRSGVGRMIHIDFAYPLDGESDISNLQILVEAKKGF